MIRVEIQVDDRGRFSVGEIPQQRPQAGRAGTPQGEQPALTPARNIDEALDIARELLTRQNATADASMRKGYRRAAPLLSDATETPSVQATKY